MLIIFLENFLSLVIITNSGIPSNACSNYVLFFVIRVVWLISYFMIQWLIQHCILTDQSVGHHHGNYQIYVQCMTVHVMHACHL